MSRVIFMCGPAGAGKSTVARRFVDNGFVRLSFDEEAWGRGIRVQPLLKETRSAIESHLREQLLRHVRAGVDVVLDYSFWSRAMRADYRALLAPLGVVPETVYLDTPREVVLARVRARTNSSPHDVHLTEGIAMSYFDAFEPPTPDEGPLVVVTPGDVDLPTASHRRES